MRKNGGLINLITHISQSHCNRSFRADTAYSCSDCGQLFALSWPEREGMWRQLDPCIAAEPLLELQGPRCLCGAAPVVRHGLCQQGWMDMQEACRHFLWSFAATYTSIYSRWEASGQGLPSQPALAKYIRIVLCHDGSLARLASLDNREALTTLPFGATTSNVRQCHSEALPSAKCTEA